MATGTHRRLALATPHTLATAAGVEAFERGGNALDAALAAAASLTVALPDNCALGGDLFAIVRRPAGEVVVVNASGPAAAAVDVTALRERHGWLMPAYSGDTVTVPGLLDGWRTIWRLGAVRPWAEIFGAAVEQARSGVPVAGSVAGALERYEDRLRSDPGMAEVFFPAGERLAAGGRLVQPKLARTLERLADRGAREFYEGSLGREWLRTMAGRGAVLDPEDLAGFEAEVAEPLVAPYGAAEVVTAPPNSQGALLLKTLAMAGPQLDPLSLDAPALALAFHAAVQARWRHLADPRCAGVRLDLLLESAPPAGAPSPGTAPTGTGDTVALVAADGDGWAVSLVQSLFESFGCGVLDPGTGIIAHNRGRFFSLDSSSPNVLAPGKRPAHTLTPVLVRERGQLRAVLGTMGGLAQTQVLSHVVSHLAQGRSVSEAVGAPRWTLGALDGQGGIQAEENVPAAAAEALRAHGWAVSSIPALSLDVGNAVAVACSPQGELTAAADPRGQGVAVATTSQPTTTSKELP